MFSHCCWFVLQQQLDMLKSILFWAIAFSCWWFFLTINPMCCVITTVFNIENRFCSISNWMMKWILLRFVLIMTCIFRTNKIEKNRMMCIWTWKRACCTSVHCRSGVANINGARVIQICLKQKKQKLEHVYITKHVYDTRMNMFSLFKKKNSQYRNNMMRGLHKMNIITLWRCTKFA